MGQFPWFCPQGPAKKKKRFSGMFPQLHYNDRLWVLGRHQILLSRCYIVVNPFNPVRQEASETHSTNTD